MNEVTVRNLTPRELAESMRYSDDLATKALALHIIANEIACDDTGDKISDLEDEAAGVRMDLAERDEEIESLKDLLRECRGKLPSDFQDLHERITEAL